MKRGEARRVKLRALSPAEIRIDSFAHDGRGVGHADGKAVFVEGALPGEAVVFSYTALHRDYAEGRVEQVLSPSPDRVEPVCPHFSVCGGCRLQHLALAKQIEAKQSLLLEQLRRLGKVVPETVLPPLTGPAWGYRRKARLGVKYVVKKARALVGFREKASSLITEIDSCPVLHPSVGQRIAEIRGLIGGLSVRDRIPQIEVSVGDETCVLVFRVLADPTQRDLARMSDFGLEHGLTMCLQRHGPDSVVAVDPDQPVELSYRLPSQDIRFDFAPGDFTQVNQAINAVMVDRVLDELDLRPEHEVLDLFCGLGNFTLPVAKRVHRVVGIEGEEGLVAQARRNADRNGIANAEFHRADLFQNHSGAEWIDRAFDRVLLDPSRAGAQEVLCFASRWRASRIVYVSCNPSTLARDAGILVNDHGYRLVSAGVMDMFPHTAHVESLAVFERRWR